MLDHYQILGVNRSASAEQIKAAYKKMAKRYHPDTNNNDPHAEEVFKRINAAYQVLSDEAKKHYYDHTPQTATATEPATTSHSSSAPHTQQQAYRPNGTTYQAADTYYQPSSKYKYAHIPLRVRRALHVASVIIGIAVLIFGVYLYEVAPSISAKHSYKEAVALVKEGKYQEALKKLNHAVIFYPQLIEAQMLKADLSFRVFKDYSGAYAGYSEAIKHSQDTLPKNIYFLRGMAAFKAQSYRRAIDDLSQTISEHPKGNAYTAKVYFFRAQAQYYVTPHHKRAICNDLAIAKQQGVKEARHMQLLFCESITQGAVQNIGLDQGLGFWSF